MKSGIPAVALAVLLLTACASAQQLLIVGSETNDKQVRPGPVHPEHRPLTTHSNNGLETDNVPRFEVGGLFTTLVIPNDTRVGFGVRGVYNLNPSLSAEGEINWSLSNNLVRVEGGRMIQGLFGAKAGYRGTHLGFFAKGRGGFVNFSDVSSILPALDAGGVIELYPSRRWSVRGDLGDTMIFQTAGARVLHSFQFSLGMHCRF